MANLLPRIMGTTPSPQARLIGTPHLVLEHPFCGAPPRPSGSFLRHERQLFQLYVGGPDLASLAIISTCKSPAAIRVPISEPLDLAKLKALIRRDPPGPTTILGSRSCLHLFEGYNLQGPGMKPFAR